MIAAASKARGPQHLQALARANEVRLARAGLKKRVADGLIEAADVVVDPPWEADTMTISDLLLSQRRWGHTRCRRFLATIPLSENKQIGTMTLRQRRAVAAGLRTIESPARMSVPAFA